jgi:hypothetical protein
MDEFDKQASIEENSWSLERKIASPETLMILGDKYDAEFMATEILRRPDEIRWAENLRQCKGIYDPDIAVKIKPNKSRIYPKYTRSKEVPCVSKLNSMLIPDNDRNWSTQATPEPELTDEQLAIVLNDLVRTGSEPAPEAYETAIKAFAEKVSGNMQNTMDDQLTQIKYKEIQKKVIRSGVRYGTGIVKGPLHKTIKRRKAVKGLLGPKYETREQKIPIFENVPIWNYYPDMSTPDQERCEFEYELHCMSKHELRILAKRSDFNGEVINKYIAENPTGDFKFKQWQIDLQQLGDDIVSRADIRKYQVLERWGYVDGADLIEAGVEGITEEEKETEFYANVWILGKKIIKIVKSPTPYKYGTDESVKIYHLFYFEKDETSIFGTGLPRAFRDTQITICSAARMLLDNAAITSGGIFEIAVEALAAGEDTDDIYPMRIFRREGTGSDLQYQAIRVHNVDSHIPEYINIIDLFKSIGDEESTLPAFLYGDGGGHSNETAKGISIRSSNTNITIGDIVKSYDECNESVISSLYSWNMEFNEDETIKGDSQVKACGSSSLLTKEVRTQTLDYFATTITPADEPYFNRGYLLRERAKAHDLDADKLVRTDAQAQEIIASQIDAEAEALMKAKMKAEIGYTESKAAHMQAKAGTEGPKQAVAAVKVLADATKEEKKGQTDKK